MNTPTKITIEIHQRPDLAYSQQFVASLTIDGAVHHWPQNKVTGVGFIADEHDKKALPKFLHALAEYVTSLT